MVVNVITPDGERLEVLDDTVTLIDLDERWMFDGEEFEIISARPEQIAGAIV